MNPDPERTLPTDPAQTVPSPVPDDPAALHAAEAGVAAEWEVGDVILDLYEVKEIHEGGGMGMVYRVHHRGWNTELAVKSPRRDYFQTAQQKENFSQECETWINLGLHPHIVSCHYVRALGGIPRVFAEYVEGGSLKDWIDSRKLYEGGPEAALKRMLDIAIQFAWGLHYAHEHEQKFIHQDVKPANVMLTPDGIAKVTDFGLAKARAAAGESFVAGAGRSILVSSGGMTPAYCSPEQASGKALSRRTDIWSWGLSVLEMFAGEMFWSAGQAAGESLEIYAEQAPSNQAIPPMPGNLVTLLRSCFQNDPSARPSDFKLISEKIKELYRAVGGNEYPREVPLGAALQASAFNNRGVSLLDLGQSKGAEQCFEEALREQPGHPQAIFNRGRLLWRRGRITDLEILTALTQSQQNRPCEWTVPYLIGMIHLERQDGEGAMSALTRAKELNSGIELRKELQRARELETDGARSVRILRGGTSSIALSADARWALSGSYTRRLRRWDLAANSVLEFRESPTDGEGPGDLLSLVLSADNRWAFSGHKDATLRLWDMTEGRCTREFVGHAAEVRSVGLSGNGRCAVSGSEDKTVRLWDLTTGNCLRTIEGEFAVNCVAYSPDGERLLSGGSDNTLRLWESATGECLRTMEGHTHDVNSVSFSSDGRWALSGSSDTTLRLWNLSNGHCVRVFTGHAGWVNSAAFNLDDSLAVSGSDDETVRLWELASGRCLRTFDGYELRVHSVALSRDAHYALANDDISLRFYDTGREYWLNKPWQCPPAVCQLSSSDILRGQQRFNTILSEAARELASEAFAKVITLTREARAITGYEFSTMATGLSQKAGLRGVRIGLSAGWCLRMYELESGIYSMALSSDGRRVLVGQSSAKLFDLSSGRCVQSLMPRYGMVFATALSLDGRLALTSEVKELRLWEPSSGTVLTVFEEDDQTIHSVALSADSRWAISGSGCIARTTTDSTLVLWDVKTGRRVRTYPGHTNRINAVALSADGRSAISGSYDKTLRLWDVSSGVCVRIFEGHSNYVTSVSISANGRWVLSGSYDNMLRLWELSNGRCIRIFAGHTDWVTSVAFSPDDRWAISGGRDKTVRVWEVSSGACVRSFEGHTETVTAVAFSSDGGSAVSAGHDGAVRLWELDWDYEFHSPADCAKEAEPHLKTFLTLRCQLAEDGVSRIGQPTWSEDDFQELLVVLQRRGFGWLRSEGVRHELEKMAARWQDPPQAGLWAKIASIFRRES